MSRSPSDINTKNIHILTCDLGWSNGYLFRLSSRRPEIESRRGSCWLSLLTSFNWIDFFSFGYVKDTLVHIEAVCRAQMPIFLLGKWKTRRQSRAGLSWFYHVAITIKSCPLMLGSSMVRPFSSLGGWVALTSSLFWLPVSVAILLNKDPKYKKEPCLGPRNCQHLCLHYYFWEFLFHHSKWMIAWKKGEELRAFHSPGPCLKINIYNCSITVAFKV